MNNIKQELKQTELVQRIHVLEKILDENQELNDLIANLKELQKKMVNAKEFHQPKQYQVYKDEYDALYEKILDFPFVEEYLDLLEEINEVLLNITNIIETKINVKIRE